MVGTNMGMRLILGYNGRKFRKLSSKRLVNVPNSHICSQRNMLISLVRITCSLMKDIRESNKYSTFRFSDVEKTMQLLWSIMST